MNINFFSKNIEIMNFYEFDKFCLILRILEWCIARH